MKSPVSAEKLICDLLSDPERFNKKGRAYELLQAYFAGYPRSTLRPLLKSENWLVQRAALWVVNELGKSGCELLDEIVPLASSEHHDLKYDAIEVLAVCSTGERIEYAQHLLRGLESHQQVIRILVMRLVSRRDPAEIGRVVDFISEPVHSYGLKCMAEIESLREVQVASMLKSTDAVTRKYAVIIAKHLFGKFPQLIESSLTSDDDDIAKFAGEVIGEYAA